MPIRDNAGDEDRDQDDPRNREEQTEEEQVELPEGEQRQEEPEVDVVEAQDDREEGDERIAQPDDERPQERQRHRETAAERRQRAKQARERDKRELDFQRRELDRLQKQVFELNQGHVVTRVTELDNRISSAQAEIAQWERVKAAAITKHEGADAVAADNFLKEAQLKRDQALWDKQQIAQAQQQPRQQEPAFQRYKDEFLSANSWYHQDGVDEDSLIVKAIDHAVAQEYRPTDPRYWQELQKRVDARLGKNGRQQSRDDSEEDDDVDDEPAPQRRRAPPVGGSNRSNSSGGSGRQQITLSPARVQAMKDAGLWDDPKVRAKMAKTYSEYDRNNRG
jgi:hypothetical protein